MLKKMKARELIESAPLSETHAIRCFCQVTQTERALERELKALKSLRSVPGKLEGKVRRAAVHCFVSVARLARPSMPHRVLRYAAERRTPFDRSSYRAPW